MRNINAKAAKAVRKRAKSKGRDYQQVMLSIDSRVYSAFKHVCSKEHLKHSAVVEEFMKFYIETA